MMRVQHSLAEGYRSAAAALYWHAFSSKLDSVMGPKPRALAYLTRVMRLDLCIAALDDDQLLGIVGLQSTTASFAGGTISDFRAVYGTARGVLRLPALLWVGGARPAANVLMIDGFAVAPDQIGQGIGSALLQEVFTYARANGFQSVHLDVADKNLRAKQFYARHGFHAHAQRSIWPLGRFFGFKSVLRMVRDLS